MKKCTVIGSGPSGVHFALTALQRGYQVDMIEAAEEMMSRKSLSLNIDARREEREQDLESRLERENERRAALGLDPVESLDDIEDEEIPDILLDQAAGIVTDLAQMRELDSPERTAAIRP